MIDEIYEEWHSSESFRNLVEEYHKDGKYLLIITILDEKDACEEVAKFCPYIKDKVVVEIGAGVGFLALEMAKHAKEVYAFELDPAWSWDFVKTHLYKKPKNMNFVFGDARNFTEKMKADVVVIYTGSDIDEFIRIARSFDPKVVILNGKNLKLVRDEVRPFRGGMVNNRRKDAQG